MKRGPAPKPAAERFWSKVTKTAECWIWDGAKQAGGYGRFMLSSSPRTLILAHRYSYEQQVGPIVDDLTIDHLCRNPSCVNPAHLEPVTRSLNSLRGSRNAVKTHCDHGHEFTEDNIYSPPSRPSVRLCRACRKADTARRVAARQERVA